MTDQQLYLSIGLPTMVALAGIPVNVGYFVHIENRISSLESRLDRRIDSIESRLDARIDRLDTKIDLLTGKVVDIDNRLSHLEQQ